LERAVSNLEFLETLQAVIQDRLAGGSTESYTARLAAKGVAKVAQKLGEEGVELALAAVVEADERVKQEAADLLYHLLLLLVLRGIPLGEVVAALEERHRGKTAAR
jgi:phosphoribosyl-ATP pyrophosphohydrolase/phosphoribosyl-AMP cyclohydrolase